MFRADCWFWINYQTSFFFSFFWRKLNLSLLPLLTAYGSASRLGTPWNFPICTSIKTFVHLFSWLVLFLSITKIFKHSLNKREFFHCGEVVLPIYSVFPEYPSLCNFMFNEYYMEVCLSIFRCEKIRKDRKIWTVVIVLNRWKKGCSLSALWKEALKLSPVWSLEEVKNINSLYSFVSTMLNRTEP